MNEAVTYVTQSKYFSPAFNAAIFDGPIRIYFAQYQEAQALKLYFNLQERFGETRRAARGFFKERGRNIFVMLYPTDETFELSFDQSNASGAGAVAGHPIARESFGSDVVLGVCGPLDEVLYESLANKMDEIVLAGEA
jgi:hypothetical protein